MDQPVFNTPILMLVFNRPERTRRVFEEIRKARPPKLFMAADGPRPDRPEDIEKCRLVREIIKEVDWPCEVQTLFRETNLKCKKAISEGIDWFFSHVEAGIILEDDCVADPTFFLYCQELLEKYKDDARIMHISGNNFQQDNPGFKCLDSYYFSRIPSCWGWATWRRAWNLYDIEVRAWPKARAEKLMYKIFGDEAVAHRWEYFFDKEEADRLDPLPQARLDWDGRWGFACLVNNGFCINPRVNLVSNIGFDVDARIARDPNHPLANMPAQAIEIPLKHPETISINLEADRYVNRYVYKVNRYWHERLKWFFKSRFTKQYKLLKKILKSH